jgi:NAD(P) transhydrogenase
MEHYDFIVIGSGPAGRRAAIQAAKFGKKVLVVERGHRVGGFRFTPAPFRPRH